MMDRSKINDTEVIFVYVTWPLTCAVHILQIYYMRPQHPELRYILPVFALTAPLFIAFAICHSPDTRLYSPSAAFPLFTAFRVVWAANFIAFQYVTSILRVAGSMSGRLPPMIVYVGGATQCVLLGAGLTLLALFDIKMVWAVFVVSHTQLLALLVHCWVTVPQLRRQTFFLWTLFVFTIALLSAVFLLLGSLVPRWPFPVFSAQCIFALIDAIGALFRHRFMSRVDGTADDGAFTRLTAMSPSSTCQSHRLESLPSLPGNRQTVEERV